MQFIIDKRIAADAAMIEQLVELNNSLAPKVKPVDAEYMLANVRAAALFVCVIDPARVPTTPLAVAQREAAEAARVEKRRLRQQQQQQRQADNSGEEVEDDDDDDDDDVPASPEGVPAVHGALAGFLSVMAPDAPYTGAIFHHFRDNVYGPGARDFLYIDRIVVSNAWQGHGIGQLLYRIVDTYTELRARVGATPVRRLCCAVNVRPMNEGSVRFHERRGFACVGEEEVDNGWRRVGLFERPVTGCGACPVPILDLIRGAAGLAADATAATTTTAAVSSTAAGAADVALPEYTAAVAARAPSTIGSGADNLGANSTCSTSTAVGSGGASDASGDVPSPPPGPSPSVVEPCTAVGANGWACCETRLAILKAALEACAAPAPAVVAVAAAAA